MEATIDIAHAMQRVRHETRRRSLTTISVEDITPRMRRVVLQADDSFADFVSLSPDDHVKLFFQTPDGSQAMRDFTPRAFDVEAGRLTIDFALHQAGPAMDWAVQARPGAKLEIGGPRGSMVVADDFDWYWLIGDETAMPAIGRWVEQMPAGKPVLTAIAIDDAGEKQTFATQADWHPRWTLRSELGPDDAVSLQTLLAAEELPPGDGFVFIAAEASVARALRSVLVTRGQPKAWIKAAGYWKRGQADTHERIED